MIDERYMAMSRSKPGSLNRNEEGRPVWESIEQLLPRTGSGHDCWEWLRRKWNELIHNPGVCQHILRHCGRRLPEGLKSRSRTRRMEPCLVVVRARGRPIDKPTSRGERVGRGRYHVFRLPVELRDGLVDGRSYSGEQVLYR